VLSVLSVGDMFQKRLKILEDHFEGVVENQNKSHGANCAKTTYQIFDLESPELLNTHFFFNSSAIKDFL
jgi:hypothetical protein